MDSLCKHVYSWFLHFYIWCSLSIDKPKDVRGSEPECPKLLRSQEDEDCKMSLGFCSMEVTGHPDTAVSEWKGPWSEWEGKEWRECMWVTLETLAENGGWELERQQWVQWRFCFEWKILKSLKDLMESIRWEELVVCMTRETPKMKLSSGGWATCSTGFAH